MTIKEICGILDAFAPPALKEDFDNVGLLVGDASEKATGALICIDVTKEVIQEAIDRNCNLVISHHPIILSGIKKLTGNNYVEQAIILAIKNSIAIYSGHTNFDNIYNGVNAKICDKLGIQNATILSPQKGALQKLVTFIPTGHADKVKKAILEAGAGEIGNYDYCSFNTKGIGSYRGGENSTPFAGKKSHLHEEEEIRFETIYPKHKKNSILKALLTTHPYEEVAYDLYEVANEWQQAGSGMFGNLPSPVKSEEFLLKVKSIFNCGIIKHTPLLKDKIQKIAVCGGSGSFLLGKAIAEGADLFITGDFKYHQFFDAENRIVIADIGHYESEQFTKEVFFELLTKKIPSFAVHLSRTNTNPIKYL